MVTGSRIRRTTDFDTAGSMTACDDRTWAVVLAAGEGSWLRCLTTDAAGIGVPKQFCSLRGGPSLLHETLQRAAGIARPEQVCAIVAAQHRCWWRTHLCGLPRGNVIVQPQNRGTANGILLALLRVLQRDPQARVVFLPSDHYVRDELALHSAMHRSVRALRDREAEIVFLGIAPEDADPGLGYIVPGPAPGDRPAGVLRFVEKPARDQALALIGAGALWNAFIVAAEGRALLNLFVARDPESVAGMRLALHADTRCASAAAMAALYRRLPSVDFSRDVAAGHESVLTVLQVAPCGWSDLGTVERVAKTLNRPAAPSPAAKPVTQSAGSVNLEERLSCWRESRSPARP